MKIVVASDSHGKTDTLQSIVQIEQADVYLLCGDSGDEEEAIYPFVSVKGNCDFYPYERDKVLTLMGYTFFITHGHVYHDLTLSYQAQSAGADIVLFGHTHVPYQELSNHILFLNPGSLSYPRGGSKAGYLVLTIMDRKKDQDSINHIQIERKLID